MTGSPHLDAVRLSALLDGGADPAVAAHLADCALCTDRLDSWRRARRRLADPPPPSAERRDAAVGAALAVFGAPPASAATPASAGAPASGRTWAGDRAASGTGVPAGGRVGPAARPDPAAVTTDGGRRAGRRWAPRPGSIAAGIAVLLVAGGISAAAELHVARPSASGKGTTTRTTAGPATAGPKTFGPQSAGPATAGPATAGAPSAGSSSGASSVPLPTATSAAGYAPSAGLPSLGHVADPQALARVLRQMLAAHPGASVPSGVAGRPGGSACAGSGAAIAGQPRDTHPLLEATASYAGVPAEVFVFGPLHPVGIAVASATCRLLVQVDL